LLGPYLLLGSSFEGLATFKLFFLLLYR